MRRRGGGGGRAVSSKRDGSECVFATGLPREGRYAEVSRLWMDVMSAQGENKKGAESLALTICMYVCMMNAPGSSTTLAVVVVVVVGWFIRGLER